MQTWNYVVCMKIINENLKCDDYYTFLFDKLSNHCYSILICKFNFKCVNADQIW